MTAAQIGAFEQAAGLSATTLAVLCASIVAVLVLLWLAWVLIGQFRAFVTFKVDGYDALWTFTLAIVITLTIGFFVRP